MKASLCGGAWDWHLLPAPCAWYEFILESEAARVRSLRASFRLCCVPQTMSVPCRRCGAPMHMEWPAQTLIPWKTSPASSLHPVSPPTPVSLTIYIMLRRRTPVSHARDAGRGPPANLGKLLKAKGVQECTRKCVATCVRGGEGIHTLTINHSGPVRCPRLMFRHACCGLAGAPGLGPLSVRKEIIVFNEGFRSRQYCLSECTQVCAAALARK